MGLLAERAAARMQTRQTYRTMSRMQRRRSAIQGGLGMREDYAREEPAETTATASAAPEPEYMGELERLAQFRDQGILSEEEFEAKKKQVLGI
jgi:hypothetical protein